VPSAPGAPAIAADLGDVAIPLQGLPRTAQEVRGLRERREILRDQLDRAANRRAELVRELGRDGPGALAPEARVGAQQRLDALDARILQIERDQAATERLLSNAAPDVLAVIAEEDRHSQAGADEDEILAAVSGAFGFGVLLTLLVGGCGAAWRAGGGTPPTGARSGVRWRSSRIRGSTG
jgi:hypothetical protein